MNDDWKSFLEEVQEENKTGIEWSKRRDKEQYDEECDCEACKIK